MLTWMFKVLFYLPVKILVKSNTIPSDPSADLNIDPGKPILYIFKANSIIDFLALHFLSKKRFPFSQRGNANQKTNSNSLTTFREVWV